MLMFLKIFITLSIMIITFSGCAKTVNNIDKSEAYKALEEVTVIGQRKEFTIRYNHRQTSLRQCQQESNVYFEELSYVTKLGKLLENKNVKTTSIDKPIKKLLIIRPILYESKFDARCSPDAMTVMVNLYDVEEVSKDWTKEDIKKVINDISALNEKNLIYSKNFYLDKKYNVYSEVSLGFQNVAYQMNSDPEKETRNVEKFFKTVVVDLEKNMQFPIITQNESNK